MSAKFKPPMPVIKDWLNDAKNKLKAVGIPSAELDAELILAEIIQKNRIFLHAHPEQIIYSKHLKKANLYLRKRLNRIPLAYIFGYKEFYGRNFKVNKNTLIPRPESEEIIDILKTIFPSLATRRLFTQTDCAEGSRTPRAGASATRKDCCLCEQTTGGLRLADIGTGSGCLGITAKLEFPDLDVTLTDISQKALVIAKLNARTLKTPVKTLKSDLLDKVNSPVDIILANLPYVDKTWEVSPEVHYEPQLALYANDSGQELIKKLIIQATKKLSDNGYLIIEADPVQHKSLINFAKSYNFEVKDKLDYIIAFKYTK